MNGGGAREVCLSAVRAGLQMLENLTEVNRFLKQHFNVEFGTRIGIHYGVVVIGQMGHPRKMQFTAIGDGAVQAALQDQLVDVLVDLHALDPRSLELGLLGDGAGIREHLEAELAIWEGLYHHDADPWKEERYGF